MFQGKRNPTKFDPVIRSKYSPRRKRALFVKRSFGSFLNIRKPKFSLLWGLTGCFICLLLVAFAYFFLISDKFLLTEVIVEGVDNKELKESVENYYNIVAQSKKLYFIRQNKTFSFPKESFESDLLTVVPKINEVEVEVKVPHGILIRAKARKEAGVWCKYNIDRLSENCYFYDAKGVIYETAPQSLKGSLIVYIRDGRFENPALGEKVLDQDLIEYTENLIQLLSMVDLKPEYIFFKNNIDIHTGFNKGWEAYFLRENNIQESVENLKLVLDKEIGNRVGELEYVDLRLLNKVFYKFRN